MIDLKQNTDKEEVAKPPTKKSKLPNLNIFSKFKGVKNIEIVIAVVLVCIIGVIYLSTFTNNEKTTNNQSGNTISYYSQTSTEYATLLEKKLNNTLGQIKGAGNVTSMVTVESGPELIIAYSTDERTVTQNGNSTVTVVKTPIVVSGKPIVLQEITPKVKSVIIVASGASDLRIRLNIQSACASLLGISEHLVNVFA